MTTDDGFPISELRWRERSKVRGRVRSLRIHPVAGVVALGRDVVLEGVVGSHRGPLAMVDPEITVEATGDDH